MIRALLGDSGATAEAVASVELARRSGELRVEAQAFRGLGRVLDWRGREDSALAAFGEAEQRFREARDHSWLAVTLMALIPTMRPDASASGPPEFPGARRMSA